MLKSIQSNNSPGHTHNGQTSVVDLSTDFCPGNHLTKSNKMRNILSKISVTKLEYGIIQHLLNSDFTTDGEGIKGYIDHEDFNMKIYRGVLSSLAKKEIIKVWAENDIYGLPTQTWAEITDNFQQNINGEYKLINIKEDN